MKRCLTSLAIREMQIETTMRTISYPLGWLLSKKQKISVNKHVRKQEPLCTIGGKWRKWYKMVQPL